MEALECIKTRRSVRRFTEEPVTPEQVAEVVAAAAYAPSWKNTQIARYILVEDLPVAGRSLHLRQRWLRQWNADQKRCMWIGSSH